MSDLVKLDRIEALARPPKADLIRARHAIHIDLDLQRLFDRAEAEHWDVERLAGELEDGLFRVLGTEVPSEVARYLAEEFQARDKSKTLLVSSETGLAVAEVPPDAIYQPGPVPREGTDTLATPLPRLKPEIETAIIQHHNTRAAESSLIARLETRARSTELQKAEGDSRLRIATRAGRETMAEELSGELPMLLRDLRGASGRLLRLCHFDESPPETHTLTLDLTLLAQVSVGVADVLAVNFRHDAYGSTKERIRSAWTRVLAKGVSRLAHETHEAREVLTTDPLHQGLLLADANVVAMVKHPDTLLTQGAAAILDGSIYLALNGHGIESYESTGRWCVDAWVDAKLYLDPTTIKPLSFTDVVESGLSVEVIP